MMKITMLPVILMEVIVAKKIQQMAGTTCDVCDCLETPPTTAAPEPTEGPTGKPTDGCGSPHWKGDDYCDDENNNAACDFDGGDCCQEDPIKGWDNYCKECECLEAKCDEKTESHPWFKDNYCDDFLNTPGCFDGGDCCQKDPIKGWDNYCKDCSCYE